MRLADDDRARVPFALVGVLLLVGSATFAASLSTRGPSPVDTSADAAAERVDAETTAALRTAVRDAARAAGRNPVTVAAEDGPGSGLAGPNTFRRYLRLRIFLAARDAVAPVEHRRGDAVARVSLGESVDTVSEAVDRVSVSAVDGGTELRATVSGLVVRVQHDGRVVDTQRRNRTVTVGVPVLALHDRTVAFQNRLDAGPLESPGLARRMTVGLTAVAQARGLGQYAGLPISNVVANRHVALSTNAGLLDAQRAAFGRTDPDAAAGVRAATLRTGATDLLSPHTDSQVVSAVTGELPDPNAAERATGDGTGNALPATRTVSVGVNGTADAAFLSLLRGENGESLESIRQNGYGAEVWVEAGRRTVRSEYRPGPGPPGWSPDARPAARSPADFLLARQTDGRVAELIPLWRAGGQSGSRGGARATSQSIPSPSSRSARCSSSWCWSWPRTIRSGSISRIGTKKSSVWPSRASSTGSRASTIARRWRSGTTGLALCVTFSLRAMMTWSRSPIDFASERYCRWPRWSRSKVPCATTRLIGAPGRCRPA